jgi:hypothetical protein
MGVVPGPGALPLVEPGAACLIVVGNRPGR